MFSKVLIANRGAIACRIIRTLRRMGVQSVAVFSEADRDSLHVAQADEAYCIGPAPARSSYLDVTAILEAAGRSGAEAIHPGYGFLSENAEFAETCAKAGLVFIGPTPEQMRRFGLKHVARATATEAGVPLLPGTQLLPDVQAAIEAGERIGYPVMLKSTAGGGGIGMRLCRDGSELAEAYASVARLAASNFSDGGLYLERFVEVARHIEVQVFGDGRGRVVALGERDCSLQRRNQKVIEETPAPGLSGPVREALARAAIKIAERVDYQNAGTVEFVYDAVRSEFYFLEVNTRLQVEHGVTEAVTGIDLVEWMVRQAAGERIDFDILEREPATGWSMQARIYAENPAAGFQPASGRLTEVSFPSTARVETWVTRGTTVPADYDPMLAKVIVHAPTRPEAIAALQKALAATRLAGVTTNLHYLQKLLGETRFWHAEHTTRWLDQYRYAGRGLAVLEGGTQTTLQDYPGRLGLWDVGVPPSGPMDALTHRLANRLIGNPSSATTLEITLNGPVLLCNSAVRMALCGPALEATLDDQPLPLWTVVDCPAGSRIKIGRLGPQGMRAYLAIAGGFDVPEYLGSRATFTLGGFGGHDGRALVVGDVLLVAEADPASPAQPAGTTLAPADRPDYGSPWQIGVRYGPHGAPDFFTANDIDTLFSSDWEVHYNSSRTGVRLIGPKPEWARSDGGEAGLHPSNIHDNAYAIGSIDFTGDMPILLGPDGPSLGGFVCPGVIADAELWKLGQLRPGDRLRFVPWDAAQAQAGQQAEDAWLEQLRRPAPAAATNHATLECPVLRLNEPPSVSTTVCYRRAGDNNILVEYGPRQLDLALRFRVQALMDAVRSVNLPGLIDLTPGIRSLQVHFDSRVIPAAQVLELLEGLEVVLPPLDQARYPSRIVHLPLSWDDPATQLAIEKYVSSVRPDAPWCPSNIEFIRRINGLPDIHAVKEIVFNASYLVMGLGDVYLGAPVATPVDPRHRLVTTKYNPARTWTPENAVGIGGAYLCVYGMEGPGGYQFVGRTLQMWNTYRETAAFTPGQPWLLRFFDQIRFYPVSAAELLEIRAEFPRGRYPLRIEHSHFDLAEYLDFLQREATGIAAFKQQQQAAFEAERARWAASGQATFMDEPAAPSESGPVALEANEVAIAAPVSGNLWQVLVQTGETLAAGQVVAVVEAMKAELPVRTEQAGVVSRVLVEAGQPVRAGQALLVLRC